MAAMTLRLSLTATFAVLSFGMRAYDDAQLNRGRRGLVNASKAKWRGRHDVYVKSRGTTDFIRSGNRFFSTGWDDWCKMSKAEGTAGRERWDFELLSSDPYTVESDFVSEAHNESDVKVGTYRIVRHTWKGRIKNKYLCTGGALGGARVVGLYPNDKGTGECHWYIQEVGIHAAADTHSYWIRNVYWEQQRVRDAWGGTKPSYLGMSVVGWLGTTSPENCGQGDGLNCVWYLMERGSVATPDAERAGISLKEENGQEEVFVHGEWQWIEQVVVPTKKWLTSGTETSENETDVSIDTVGVTIAAGWNGFGASVGVASTVQNELQSSFTKFFKESQETKTEITIGQNQIDTRPHLWQWVYDIRTGSAHSRWGLTRTTSFWFTSAKTTEPQCFPGHCDDLDCQSCSAGFKIE